MFEIILYFLLHTVNLIILRTIMTIKHNLFLKRIRTLKIFKFSNNMIFTLKIKNCSKSSKI